MIENMICPYCCRALVKAENQENSRSVEHLIPNAALTRRRKNDEGDFYACRKCNSKKSSMDYMLGIIAKAQSNDDTLAANTLINSVVKENGATKRIIDMLSTAKTTNEGTVQYEMPINARELIEYIHYLGKGQYFKIHGKTYDYNTQIMDVTFANKKIMSWIENSYVMGHNSNPFQDLQKNPHTEIVNDGECLIHSKNDEFMFVFHDYTVLIISVLRKNGRNREKVRESESYIYQYFKYVRREPNS